MYYKGLSQDSMLNDPERGSIYLGSLLRMSSSFYSYCYYRAVKLKFVSVNRCEVTIEVAEFGG